MAAEEPRSLFALSAAAVSRSMGALERDVWGKARAARGGGAGAVPAPAAMSPSGSPQRCPGTSCGGSCRSSASSTWSGPRPPPAEQVTPAGTATKLCGCPRAGGTSRQNAGGQTPTHTGGMRRPGGVTPGGPRWREEPEHGE